MQARCAAGNPLPVPQDGLHLSGDSLEELTGLRGMGAPQHADVLHLVWVELHDVGHGYRAIGGFEAAWDSKGLAGLQPQPLLQACHSTVW